MADRTKCLLCSSASILAVILTTSYLLVYRPLEMYSENQPITGVLTNKLTSKPTNCSHYEYRDINGHVTAGLPFDVPGCEDRTPDHVIDLKDYDLTNFTVLTASSSNHFEESKDLVAGIQKTMPDKQVYYYDIGLTSAQVTELNTWCNVIYRKFDFSRYPPHVHELGSYAFKPLIMHEAFHEFSALLWMDAGIRPVPNQNKTAWDEVYDTARASGGIVQFERSYRDIFQCTTAGMYRYLPADEAKLKEFEMIGANAILMYLTNTMYNEIIRWWRLCALIDDCIRPRGHRIDCGQPRPGLYTCHRYDQSALNILAANYFKYVQKRVPTAVLLAERRVTHMYSLKKGGHCAL